MFMQMKSNNSDNLPCICKDKCPCHHDIGDNWKAIGKACLPIIVIFVLIFSLLYFWYKKHPGVNKTRLIEVNGQMCEAHYKITHHSSTGAPRGHDMAVCK